MSWPQQPGSQLPGPLPPAPQAPRPQPPAPPPRRGTTQSKYANAVQPPPHQRPPHRVSKPAAGPPRRRRRLLLVVVIVAMLAVAGVVAGIVAASSNDNQPTSGQLSTPTGAPAGAASGSGAQTRAAIARNAETVVHGLGNGRSNEFCPLIDHADLQRLLREKHLGKCADIKLTARTSRSEYQTFAVTDPSAIQINGDTADIPTAAISPAAFGTVEMREDGYGTWKFRFYAD